LVAVGSFARLEARGGIESGGKYAHTFFVGANSKLVLSEKFQRFGKAKATTGWRNKDGGHRNIS